MKLLTGVSVRKEPDKGYTLVSEAKEKRVKQEQEYLLQALLDGMEDDEELALFIMEQEHICRAAAGFTLAAFLIDYADFMAEDNSHYEIVDEKRRQIK